MQIDSKVFFLQPQGEVASGRASLVSTLPRVPGAVALPIRDRRGDGVCHGRVTIGAQEGQSGRCRHPRKSLPNRLGDVELGADLLPNPDTVVEIAGRNPVGRGPSLAIRSVKVSCTARGMTFLR